MISRRSLLAASLLLPACGGGRRLRIGFQDNGLLPVARARRDLDADWTGFNSGPPLLEAMSVGAIDLGGTGDTPPIIAQSAGANIVYVAAQPVSGAAGAIVVPRGSMLQHTADLRGRRVAWLRGSSAQSFVGRALREAGLALGDVEAINLAPRDAAAAFAGGSLDAWVVWDPWFAAAERAGARVLVPGRPLAASTSFLLANRDFAHDRASELSAALDTLAATARWAEVHRGELVALTGSDARAAARQDLALMPLTPAVIAGEQALADRLHAQGAIPGRIDVAAAAWRGWTL